MFRSTNYLKKLTMFRRWCLKTFGCPIMAAAKVQKRYLALNRAARADMIEHNRCYFKFLNFLDYVEFEMRFKDPEPEEEDLPIESDIPPTR